MATNATKLPSGNWRCKAYYTDEQGNYRSKSFTANRKKEAEAMAAQFKMEYNHKKKPENKTIDELAEEYIESRCNVLSPSTIVGYRKIKRCSFPSIMNVRSGYLTQQMYQSAVNQYAQGRSAKTVMEAHRFFSRVFEYSNIDINTKAILLPQITKTEITIPTTEEVKVIFEASKEKGIYLPIVLAALIGLRKSEIFALTWGDINDNILTINKAVVKDLYGEYVEKRTKTFHSTRSLIMPKQVIDALPERKENNERILQISPDAFGSRYNRLMAKLGMKYSFHSLRHYNASIMLQNNVPNKYAMERLGHSTDHMLKKVYQHTFSEAHKMIDQQMEQFFNNNGL